MGWDAGRFVAMMNAANKGDPSRKSLREALLAWRDFTAENPDSLLYLHTDQTGINGVPLDDLAADGEAETSPARSRDGRYTPR